MEFKKLFPFAVPYKRWLFVAIFFCILGVSAAMVPPYLSRTIVDDVFVPAAESGNFAGKERLLLLLVLGLFAAAGIRALSIFVRNLMLETFSQKTLRDLKQGMYDHIQAMSFDFFDRNRTGELMSRMTSDMEAIRVLLVMGVMHGATGLFYVLISSIILFSLHWQLALIAMAAVPFLGFITFKFRKLIQPRFKAIRKQYSVLNTLVQENISGIRVVKAFMRKDYEMKKFDRENLGLRDRRNNALRVWAIFMPIIEFLSGIAAALMLLFGGLMVIRGTISLGLWVQINGYLWMLVFPMRMLGNVVNQISLANASAERISEILEQKTRIKSKRYPAKARKIKGEVEFRNVSWATSGQTVLKNINLHVYPGQRIAIMGETGTGKTSLINLISRFCDPTEGQVFIDGIDVREYDLQFLRTNVALVAQESFLFSESMYNNLTYGREDVSPEFVKWVAQQTQAHEFIRSMSDGYGTVVGERGVGLSGGQKQRVSIARALVTEAPILLLDDSTSSVDMETETAIQESLEKLDKKVTSFIIAHRISSVKNADRIIILHDGEIIEEGTHDELLEYKGEYYRIFSTQYQDMITMRKTFAEEQKRSRN